VAASAVTFGRVAPGLFEAILARSVQSPTPATAME
jgi:hypothetical protein